METVQLGTHLNVTALFAGVAGFELGLARAGHRTSLFCESSPRAQAVLRSRFPDVPLLPDVRHLDKLLSSTSPASNILTAGFPCTDLSQAGQTKGFDGVNSSLIRCVLEFMRKRPFEHVLLENVPNWRMLHGGAYLREILISLEALGYHWAYRTIDSMAFGPPQRRKRIFLFATLCGDPRDILFHGDFPRKAHRLPLDEAAHGFYWTEGNTGLGWAEDSIPTLKGGSTIGIPSAPAILMPDGLIGTPDIADAERLQGFEAGWTACSTDGLNGAEASAANRRRWVLVGNAVNVEVAAWIGGNLADRLRFDGEPGSILAIDDKLPAAAWFDGRHRFACSIGDRPMNVSAPRLTSFLQKPIAPLSLRAARGFLQRISKSRLRLPDGLIDAVQAHIDRVERGAVTA